MVSTLAITGVISGPTGPQNITFDNIGNLYIADPSGHVIRKITPAGVSSVFAGTGAYGSLDGPAASATFSTPYSLVFDRSGNMYVADADNNKIRKITTAGVVSTFAGNGTSTSIDGNGLSASINHPINLAIDPNSNIYVSDENGQKIRKIDTSGNVTTIAGTGQIGSVDGAASSSSFYRPHGLVFDTGGNLYVADYANSKIRKITPSGIVSTFAGSGAQKSVDGIGSDAGIYAPANIVIDATGNIYANVIDNKIIKISPQGVVTTLAGSGQAGKADGIGISATFNCPMGLAIGPNGSLYVSDACNNEIRIINFNH